jgi:hypothetical protein
MLEINEREPDGTYARRQRAARGILEELPGCPGRRLDLDAMRARLDALES